jgi:hypothetical protein
VNGLRKFLRFFQVGMRGFAPDHVRIGRVSQAARNCRVNAAAELVKAFGSALSVDEFAVARVRV